MINYIIVSLRPKQYIKNLFIFVPIVFSGLLNKASIVLGIECFIYFCILSSSIYLINDLVDRNKDKWHPTKAKRPIVQGKIPLSIVIMLSALLMVTVMTGIAAMRNMPLMIIAIAFCLSNFIYIFITKSKVILDVISIAFNFELRIWAGAAIINITPSVWLQTFTFLLALFMGFAKRRAEILLLKRNAVHHRLVLNSYPISFINHLISISSGVVIVTYVLYAVSYDVVGKPAMKHFMVYTTPFIIYGVFRYLYLIYAHRLGGDPTEMVLSDWPLLLTIFLWFSSILLILYL